jgi:hypothetical protein
MEMAERVADTWAFRNYYVLIRQPEGKRQIANANRRYSYNIKISVQEVVLKW